MPKADLVLQLQQELLAQHMQLGDVFCRYRVHLAVEVVASNLER